jgi:hypothetical protein
VWMQISRVERRVLLDERGIGEIGEKAVKKMGEKRKYAKAIGSTGGL